MITTRTFLHRRSVAKACFTALTVAFGGLAFAQNEPSESRNWWSPPTDGARDRGKLSELVNMKTVYVATSFTDSRTISDPSLTRSGDVFRMVMSAFSEHKELQVVPAPSRADFAVVIRTTATTENEDRPPNFSTALDPSTAVAVEVMVLVPGSKRPDGTVRPRFVWESSTSNAQIEAASAARFTVNGFLWELSKLKEKTKVKTK